MIGDITFDHLDEVLSTRFLSYLPNGNFLIASFHPHLLTRILWVRRAVPSPLFMNKGLFF